MLRNKQTLFRATLREELAYLYYNKMSDPNFGTVFPEVMWGKYKVKNTPVFCVVLT